MNDLNNVLIEGNLVRDPELAYTVKEQAFCNFAIALNRFYKQDEVQKKEVSYFDIVIWGKRAETCAQQLKKGRGVRVFGRLKQERWQDETGNAHRKVRIIAEQVEFKPEFKSKDELKKEFLEEIHLLDQPHPLNESNDFDPDTEDNLFNDTEPSQEEATFQLLGSV
jgi:single-strand DNA-binding protein